MPRLRLALTALVLTALALAACGSAPPRATEIPTRPERLVLVVGESTDALGVEQARDPGGDAVAVALHDGTRTWVESWRVRDLELVPGSRVVARRAGELVVTTLVQRADRVAWIGTPERPELVPIGDVIAVVRRSELPGAEGPGPSDPRPDAITPPVDPARVVTFDGPSMWAVGRLTGCTGDAATVLLPGTDAPRSVRFDRIAPLALAAGDRVWAPWQGSSYPATILETRAGMVRLRWEDETEAWMPAEEVRRVLREPPSARSARRPAACVRSGAPVLVHLGRIRLAAVLESCAEGRATLLRGDGTHDARPLAELAPAVVVAGDAIEARWRDSSVYPATVVSIDGGRMRVRWEDGSEEDVGVASLVSVIEPDPRERTAPTCPPAPSPAPAGPAPADAAPAGAAPPR